MKAGGPGEAGRRWGRRVGAALMAVPISVKVMGIALGLAALLGAGMLWQIHETWHRIARRELESRGKVLGAYLAARASEATVAGDRSQLQRLLEETQAGSTDVDYLRVLGADGALLAETVRGKPSADLLAANRLGGRGEGQVALVATGHGPIRDMATPIVYGRGGVVRVGMSEERVSYEVRWLTRRLARVTTIIAALGMAAAWWLTRMFSQPMKELVQVARAVKEGNLRARAPVRAADEVGELASGFNQMTGVLQQKEEIRQKLLRKVIAAGEEERKRVARELHDQTGQALASLIAGLSVAETRAIDPACCKHLADLRELAAQTLGEVHDLSRALRPSALDDLGLAAALHKHCELFARRFGVGVDCQGIGLNGGPRLPPEVETTLYRIVQEALNNAVRHGQARSIQVLLQRKGASVLAVVEDNGGGFDARDWRGMCLAGDHLGLLGIDERAALLGGALRIESSPGSGARLFVEIPLTGTVHG